MRNRRSGSPCPVLRGVLSLTLYLGVLGIPHLSLASNGSEVQDISKKAVEVGIASQQAHESWVEEKQRLRDEIEELENLLDHIRWQRKKLAVYKGDLEEKIAGLKEKAEAMEAVNMKLLPILEENLARLKASVDGDIPGNLSKRRESIHHAAMVLNDYDMGLLDKVRAVLDAVAREVDLGHRVQVSEDETLVEGQGRRVKMLQVGRVGLYALTLDSQKAYQWDRAASGWRALEGDITSIHEAIEMAEGIRLLGLSKLPVARPESINMQEEAAQ